MAEVVGMATERGERMTRSCPVCVVRSSFNLYRSDYSDSTAQLLVECAVCGMIYASVSPVADYAAHSKYAVDGASGSGESEQERERLDELVRIVGPHLPLYNVSILDIGCARGGLMEAFERGGYSNVVGIDPSQDCVVACRSKSLGVSCGDVYHLYAQWDCITLSHVLEHLWDVPAALASISRALAPSGILYVETPNAQRYPDDAASTPYLAINREHVNHFSLNHLCAAVSASGLQVIAAGERNFLHFSTSIPSIYVIARKAARTFGQSVRDYLEQSAAALDAIDLRLQSRLPLGSPVILYGYGEFAQTLLRTRALREAMIVQVVDRDPGKLGQRVRSGLTVEPPSTLRRNDTLDFPILIASIVNLPSILADICAMRITNEIITIEGGEK
jgi:2-polyprenyl-3-methyl-5-hydroxy-6-metoxy-1,4-benzoquinol methylase